MVGEGFLSVCTLSDCRTGSESVAVVEFAPSQKVPPEKKKVDTRIGTIDQGASS